MHFSRRKIIKSLGIVAGAAAAGCIPGSSLFAQQNNATKQNSPLQGLQGKRALIAGTGKRGWKFGKFATKHPDQLTIIAIGEPDAERRDQVGSALGLSPEARLMDWSKLMQQQPVADVVIIAIAGNYTEACTAAMLAGYDVWVDRPASLQPDEVVALNTLAKDHNRELLYCYIHDDTINFMEHRVFEKNPAKC